MQACPHISVCICTYRRPELLRRLLDQLTKVETGGLFSYTAIVIDNDRSGSAEQTVQQFQQSSPLRVVYSIEPQQNIALARNRAVATASGEFVAFIDDDELPIKEWLVFLYKTLMSSDADGVLGPVKPEFPADTPSWVVQGGFYNRPDHATGMMLKWSQCRTGNVLLRRELFREQSQPFRPEFLSGEDQDFFRRMGAKGKRFVWCQEAVAYESVPPVRWTRRFLIRRAMFRGFFSQRNRSRSLLPIIESLLSSTAYLAFLPFSMMLGQATFMSCAFKISYHLGRLMGFWGINPIREQYVID